MKHIEETPWKVMDQIMKISLTLYTFSYRFIARRFICFFLAGFGYVCRHSPISKHRLDPDILMFWGKIFTQVAMLSVEFSQEDVALHYVHNSRKDERPRTV